MYLVVQLSTVSLVPTSAEDLRLFRVERVKKDCYRKTKGTLFSDKVSEFKNNVDMLDWIG